MVDNFAIAISHLLVALAAWRLIWRDDLDKEAPPPLDEQGAGFFRKSANPTPAGSVKQGDTDA